LDDCAPADDFMSTNTLVGFGLVDDITD